jgi:hypothetical protein
MIDGRPPARAIPTVLAMVVLAASTGCGVLNPSLLGGVGISPIQGLDPAQGSLVILVLNRSDAVAQAKVAVTKTNGAEVELNLTAQPFSQGTELDHVAAVQDCDVESVELTETIYAGPGGASTIASDTGPLVSGFNLNCGDVVVVTIEGTSPNVIVGLAVW